PQSSRLCPYTTLFRSFDVVDEKDLGISEARGIITDFNKLQVNHYDVVTCFEVIEHLDEATQIDLMRRLHNHLNENGTLFISTVRDRKSTRLNSSHVKI